MIDLTSLLTLTLKFIANSEFKIYLPSLMKLLTHLKVFYLHFFEVFNFSVSLDTVGYFLYSFELSLTGVFCVHAVTFHSAISFPFLGS